MHYEAGALDIGIRGVQGEGRVLIFIDGSLQSTPYLSWLSRVNDLTYIDTDLLSSLTVNKGQRLRVHLMPVARWAVW